MTPRNHASVGVLAILFLTFGTVMLDRMASLFLGPYLVEAFRLKPSQIGLLAGSSSVSWAISSLVFGAISDRIGRRRVLIPAVFLFSLCSWLSGTAQSFEQLLLYRALLGLAEGPCWSVIMALVEESSEPEHRGRNIGIVNSAGPLVGAGLTPVFVTQIASAYGWQWAFFVAGIPGLILGALIFRHVEEPTRRAADPAAPAIGDFVKLTGYRNLWVCLIGVIGLSTWLFAFSTFAPLYITNVMQQEKTTAGFLLGAAGFGGFLWSFFGTGIADRIGRKRALLLFAFMFSLQPLIFTIPMLYEFPWFMAACALFLMTTPRAGISSC